MSTSLADISKQVIIYGGIPVCIAGVMGGFLNLVIFLSLKTFRQSSCAFYLTVMSILNIGQLTFGFFFSRIISALIGTDGTNLSLFYCKFRVYISQTCAGASLTCLCLATIDQYFATCSRPRWQQLSNIKVAHRLVIITILFWLLHGVLYLVYNYHVLSSSTNTVTCTSTNPMFNNYRAYFFVLVLIGYLPITVAACFGLAAYRKIQQLAYRTVPLVRRELDKQLSKMVLIQVIVNFFTLLPYTTVNAIASSASLMSDSTIQARLQFVATIALIVYNIYFASPFYIYMCASERFLYQRRKEVLQATTNAIPIFPSPHRRALPHTIKLGPPPDSSSNSETLNRLIGLLVGLAVGDALGASVEVRSHAYLLAHPVKEMQSGGTWGLRAGQWTNDTSMALCLASSLITKQAFDPYDQLVRYKWWCTHEFLSSTGHCFDIGSATRRALDELDHLSFDTVRHQPGSSVNCSRPNIAGDGALMPLAPVPLFYYRSPALAIEYAGRSAIITHGDKKAVDAYRYYVELIVAVLYDESKEKILSERFYEERKDWLQPEDLHPDILRIAHGSYQQSQGYDGGIRGGGYIVKALEATLWAFWSDNDSFEMSVLAAVQLGDGTDTSAAIYGMNKIPQRWRKQLYAHDFIVSISHWLHYLGAQSSVTKQAPPSTTKDQRK